MTDPFPSSQIPFPMRHPREGGDPAPSVREAYESKTSPFPCFFKSYAPWTRRSWIPAFAGMTAVFFFATSP